MKRDYGSYGLATEAAIKRTVTYEVSCIWADSDGRSWAHRRFYDSQPEARQAWAAEREEAHTPSPAKGSTTILLAEIETFKSKDSSRRNRSLIEEWP